MTKPGTVEQKPAGGDDACMNKVKAVTSDGDCFKTVENALKLILEDKEKKGKNNKKEADGDSKAQIGAVSRKAPKNDWVCEPTQGPCKDKKPVYQSLGPQKPKACPAANSGWQEVTIPKSKNIKLNTK